jgi:hypothetical protein
MGLFPTCDFRGIGAFFVGVPTTEDISFNSLNELIKCIEDQPSLFFTKQFNPTCIRKKLETTNQEERNNFIQQIVRLGIKQDFPSVFSFLTNIFNFNELEDLAQLHMKGDGYLEGCNSKEWAQERANQLSKIPIETFRSQVQKEWRKFRNLILHSIPTILNLFIGAFSFTYCSKKFMTLWEKHLVLEIIYKFVQIPQNLISILNPILLVPSKVYMVAILTLTACCSGLFIYQHWIHPMVPKTLVNCDSVEDRGFENFKKKMTQQKHVERIVSELVNNHNHVLIKGKTGTGKSTMIEHLIWLHQQKQLPKELMQREFYFLKTGHMSESYASNLTEEIDELTRQTTGCLSNCLSNLILVVEEVNRLALNPINFGIFQEHILDLKDKGLLVIATTTLKGYEEIEKINNDHSLKRRFVDYSLEETREQLEAILYDFVQLCVPDIVVKKEAIEEIVQFIQSRKDERYGQPNQALDLLKKAVGRCRKLYHPFFTPDELLDDLSDAEMAAKALQAQEPHGKSFVQLLQKKQQATKISNLSKQVKQRAEPLKRVKQREWEFRKQHNQLTHAHSTWTEEQHKLFILYEFFGLEAFEAVIEEEMAHLEKECEVTIDKEMRKIACVVDKNLIQKIVQSSKTKDKARIDANR